MLATKDYDKIEAEIQSIETEIANITDARKYKAMKDVDSSIAHFGYQLLKPFSWAVKGYEEARLAGRERVAKGISKNQSPASRLWNIGLGTMEYVFAPITGVAKSVGSSIEEAAYEGIGVSKPAAEFSGKLGEQAVYFVPPGGTIKKMMLRNEPGVVAAEKAAELAKGFKPSTTEPDRYKFVMGEIEKAQPPTLRIMGPLKGITHPQVKQEIISDITQAATSALEGNLDQSQRIFKQIASRLALGEINGASVPGILAKHNLDPVDFAKMYMDTVSYGGRILGYHGRAAKELGFAFNKHPEARAIIEQLSRGKEEPGLLMGKLFDMYGSVDNFRRAMLVGQVATTMRNIWSQAGRLGVSALDEAFQGVASKTFSLDESFVSGQIGKSTLSEIQRDIGKVGKAIGLIPKDKQDKLFQVLESTHGAMAKAKLFATPVHEVALGKYSNLVNTLNRGQEFFFRRIAFESKMRQLLKKNGMSWETINPKHIPNGITEESVNHALEMTFAAMPKSKPMQELVRAWTKIPGFTFINPFPRFNFGNAIPFIAEHSPLGYLQALRPSTLKQLASNDSAVFAKAASRATIGTMMLDSAMRLRNSEYAGERWYELKFGDKYVDTRAFAPFSTYLFIAEALSHPEKLTPSDFAGAAVGLNRIAGTGLVVVDWIRAKTGESLKKQLKNFGSQAIAGFSTPSRTLSDVYAAFDKEENSYRDPRSSIMAPTMMNIPELSQRVPEKATPVKVGRVEKAEPTWGIPGGLFRQISGLGGRTKDPISKEIERVGVEWAQVYPRSNYPEADNIVTRYMAPKMMKVIPQITKSKNYKKLPVTAQREVLTKSIGEIRDLAKREFEAKHPELALKVVFDSNKKQVEIIRDLIKTYISD